MNTFRNYKYINNIDIHENTIPHTNWEHIHNRHNSNAFSLPSHPKTQTKIPYRERVTYIIDSQWGKTMDQRSNSPKV